LIENDWAAAKVRVDVAAWVEIAARVKIAISEADIVRMRVADGREAARF
jgi:hypothetical protein